MAMKWKHRTRSTVHSNKKRYVFVRCKKKRKRRTRGKNEGRKKVKGFWKKKKRKIRKEKRKNKYFLEFFFSSSSYLFVSSTVAWVVLKKIFFIKYSKEKLRLIFVLFVFENVFFSFHFRLEFNDGQRIRRPINKSRWRIIRYKWNIRNWSVSRSRKTCLWW